MSEVIVPMTEDELNLLDELTEIYPVVKTQTEMLADRGFTPTKNIVVDTKQSFINKYYKSKNTKHLPNKRAIYHSY